MSRIVMWGLVCVCSAACGSGDDDDDGADGDADADSDADGDADADADGDADGDADADADTDGDADADCGGAGESCCQGECETELTCCQGVPYPEGGQCVEGECAVSDRAAKEAFAGIDAREVLDRLAALPISTWSYRDDDTGARHIGPMAQDFQAAFEVGSTDRRIEMVDGQGVTMAAIQGLYGMVRELQDENRSLRDEIAGLRARAHAGPSGPRAFTRSVNRRRSRE